MLGEKNYTVVEGEYAKQMLDALRRRDTGELNEEDLKIKARAEQLKKKYRAIWKDEI